MTITRDSPAQSKRETHMAVTPDVVRNIFKGLETGDGTDFFFDNTQGTHVDRTQLTMNLQFEFADGYRFDDHIRYDDTDTLRNGVYPNQLLTGSAFLAQSAAMLANYPGATARSYGPTVSPSASAPPAAHWYTSASTACYGPPDDRTCHFQRCSLDRSVGPAGSRVGTDTPDRRVT